MINSEPAISDPAAENEAVNRIVTAGAGGAIALAGIAAAVVFLIWLAFYLLVFLPRGPAP